MRLVGADGSFELTILGYQFPQLATEEYDSNWLNIRVQVQHQRGRWSAQDACLLTYEAAALADWFEAIAVGREVEVERSFIEPNLLFQLRAERAGTRILRVYFELELRPKWAPYDGAPEEDLFLDLPAQPTQLTAAAESLRTQLARYPQRTER
jgi:hypothetical protein